jgi:hypothetical protein
VVKEFKESNKPLCNCVNNEEEWKDDTTFYINTFGKLSTILPSKKYQQIANPQQVGNFWQWLYENRDRIGDVKEIQKAKKSDEKDDKKEETKKKKSVAKTPAWQLDEKEQNVVLEETKNSDSVEQKEDEVKKEETVNSAEQKDANNEKEVKETEIEETKTTIPNISEIVPLIGLRIIDGTEGVSTIQKITPVAGGVKISLQDVEKYHVAHLLNNNSDVLNYESAKNWILIRRERYLEQVFQGDYEKLLTFIGIVIKYKDLKYIVKAIKREGREKVSINAVLVNPDVNDKNGKEGVTNGEDGVSKDGIVTNEIKPICDPRRAGDGKLIFSTAQAKVFLERRKRE